MRSTPRMTTEMPSKVTVMLLTMMGVKAGICQGDDGWGSATLLWRPELPSQPYLGREEFEIPGKQGEAKEKVYTLCLETQEE